MSISSTLNKLHSLAKENSWMWLFSIFCRFSLAVGFFPAGMVKIMNERFASGLSANHPMGHYLEALYHTGYYYTFIGIIQITAAIMLLIPRTVTLGAFLYFPIILNICILTFATRFDGSLFTAPLMVLANLYVIGWNYEKWKYILPFNHLPNDTDLTKQIRLDSDVQTQERAEHNKPAASVQTKIRLIYVRFLVFLKQLFNDKFPTIFVVGVFAAVLFFLLIFPHFYSVKPYNSLPQCINQFKESRGVKAGENFCNCIHQNGEPLDKCLNDYNNAPNLETQ